MSDDHQKIMYEEKTKSYKGIFYYSVTYNLSNERYSKTIMKLKDVM